RGRAGQKTTAGMFGGSGPVVVVFTVFYAQIMPGVSNDRTAVAVEVDGPQFEVVPYLQGDVTAGIERRTMLAAVALLAVVVGVVNVLFPNMGGDGAQFEIMAGTDGG